MNVNFIRKIEMGVLKASDSVLLLSEGISSEILRKAGFAMKNLIPEDELGVFADQGGVAKGRQPVCR
jgi:hypothetical protein